MSYDIDSERYSVRPNDNGTWTVVDEYYDELDEVMFTFTEADDADANCRNLNDDFNEEMGMRAQERAFEAYWGSDGRHHSDRPATRDELIRDWDRD